MKATQSYEKILPVLLAAGVFAATTMISDDAHADRRTSLNGNILIPDQDDVFVYPHLLSEYENRIRLDYGANDQSGSGMVSLRQGGLVWGIGLNRGTILNPEISAMSEINALGFPSLPLIEVTTGGSTLPPYVGVNDTFTAVDGFLSLGDFGLRLGIGGGGSVTDPDSGGETGTSHLFLTAAAGYQFANSDAFRFDTGASVFFDSAEDVQDGDTQLSGTFFGLRLDGRAFWGVGERLDFGAFGEVEVLQQSATAEQVQADPSAVGVRYGLTVGAGPVFNLPRNTTLATYVVSGIELNGADPNSEGDDDQVSQTRVLFPGVRAAFETAVLRWLYLRTGMRYDFILDSVAVDAAGTTSSRTGEFDWDVGLGFDFGAIDVDATFNPQVINSGTWLLSGTPQAPFAIVSATLAWDELTEFEDEKESPKPSEMPVAEEQKPTEEETVETPLAQQAPAKPAQPAQTPTETQPPATTAPAQETTPPATTPTPEPTPQPAPEATTPKPFEPLVFAFPEEGRDRVNDGTTRGTKSAGWEIWYDGEPWGTGHRVRSKNGEQVIAVEEGSYGLTREVGDVGGRTLKIQHRFSGDGFYEVMANDKTLVRYTEAMYEVEEYELPEGTTRITLKVGSLNAERAAATINKVEIY